MKPKNALKKLNLKKVTISTLTPGQLNRVRGMSDPRHNCYATDVGNSECCDGGGGTGTCATCVTNCGCTNFCTVAETCPNTCQIASISTDVLHQCFEPIC